MMWGLICFIAITISALEASNVEYLANHLVVRFKILENPIEESDDMKHTGQLTLVNTGAEDVIDLDWEIYFCYVRLMFPDQLKEAEPGYGHPIDETGILCYHVNGCLHKLKPDSDFKGFLKETPIELFFEATDWSSSRTDGMPNWYITNTTTNEVMTIVSTAGESLEFMADHDTPSSWKRTTKDQYNPFTPEIRFARNTVEDRGGPVKNVIPTPVEELYDDTITMVIVPEDWVVVYSNEDVMKEAEYLAAIWNTDAVRSSDKPSSRYVQILTDGVSDSSSEEAYELAISTFDSIITINGNTAHGAFYGIQSLLSLTSGMEEVPQTVITDYPRFPYRGLHLDVGRHFRSKAEVMKVLDLMAMYKLNSFYFHLTEDEGWRLEIPGLPELTQLGSKRCHEPVEKDCLMSQLGSGPTCHNAGSGYYTVADYREILQYADDRHIHVIPQINMPGHVRAAVKAMESRYEAIDDSDYLLTDFNDSSKYLTAQLFRDNTANPCISSTYRFVQKVMTELIELHKDIQPLTVFNFGGDEVDSDAWVNSTACDELIANNPELEPDEYTPKNTMLHRYFVQNVSAIAAEMGLSIAAWEDGMLFNKTPIERGNIPNANAYAYAWSNIWESGTGERAYKFANEGYKVILAHATHLYYDHPQEPSPEERGYYWATRFTDVAKTFGYNAVDVYENIYETLMGEPLNRVDFCSENSCEPLETDKTSNIIGMQCNMFSETMRTLEQYENNMFPRALAFAERAWHQASWETEPSCRMECEAFKEDWNAFANTLGYKELRRLDDMGIHYYVPVPGARISEENGNYNLEVNAHLPGLPIVYSVDDGLTWQTIKSGMIVQLEADLDIPIQVRSVDYSRTGRGIVMQTGAPIGGQSRISSVSLMTLLMSLTLLLLTV